MTNLPALPSPNLDQEVLRLVQAWRRANGPLMSVVNRLGGGMEKQLKSLPKGITREIHRITEMALYASHGLAGRGAEMGAGLGLGIGRRRTVAAVVFTGAVGGAGGLATSVAELPVTITLILAAIRAEATAAGFDPNENAIRAACIEVFAAGSPLSADDGANTAFMSARLTLTGPALHTLIASVAPKLATALGQKLTVQAVPVLGAITGAALNIAYLNYYREMARIRFALMRLTVQFGAETVLARFIEAQKTPVLTHNSL
jgi:hypothetical protein